MEAVICAAIKDALVELGLPEVVFSIEHPKILDHGDYACNIAMVLGKQVGQAPRTLAEQILAKLQGQIEYVERIEIAGPGFLNFYLSRDLFSAEAVRVLQLGDTWGKNDSWSDKKVVVEYTDPNPFKEFHIGHLFTNAVGESIARLFMMNGAEVKRVCYQGDVGLHVAYALWGMQELGITAQSDFTAKDLGRAYALGATTYKNDESKQEMIRSINKAVYDRSNEELNALYDAGRTISLAYFETIYQTVGTKFDEYFFESEAGPRGKQLVLDNPTHFGESDGARVFKGEDYGLHTRVFLNKEGLPTYEAKELALAKMKEEKLGVYDHSVISTAKEINEYFKVLLKAMSFVYPDLAAKTEHIGHGMVRLTTGKMSSRTGDVIPALEFIEDVAATARERIDASGVSRATDTLATQIAVAAIKYATLKGSIFQDSVFDKEKALSFEGDSGPYLQYTYARCLSVLEKARDVGIEPQLAPAPEVPYVLERILYRFPEAVEEALDERAPHTVVTYLTELAGEFNSFYAHEMIADASDIYAPYKTLLTSAVATTLKNGLWVLGIEAPERL
ncbi:MAG: arginine--tRNA ligase [Candidatus Paceibacteria bacterium]